MMVQKPCTTAIAAAAAQVLGRDGSWVSVSPSRQQLVVLVGHTLSWATAGRLPAALHRVQITPGSSAAASPRLSLAFKLQAAPDAVFEPAAITGGPRVQVDDR
jgi:isopenicillin N synthase-like dioxygenase